MQKKTEYKTTDFIPLFDLVLIKPVKKETSEGFLVPKQHEDKAELGEVLAIGSGRILESGEKITIPLKKGDIVIFNKYSSTKTDFGEELFLRTEDVLGVLKKK